MVVVIQKTPEKVLRRVRARIAERYNMKACFVEEPSATDCDPTASGKDD